MIECVFTLDYEVFGNGTGSVRELVLEPADRLRRLFERYDSRFVVFPEVAELELIAAARSDPDIDDVAHQLRSLREGGFEVGLHLHPWWYNGRFEHGGWVLDYSEYNLCALDPARVAELLQKALHFLRSLVGDPGFTPMSFRAGHLLLQPGDAVVNVLTSLGISLDSSVYKGGRWRQHNLDYGATLKHGHFWRFEDDPTRRDAAGRMLEVPIHTEMVPTWTMLTSKRVGLERRAAGMSRGRRGLLSRLRDVSYRRAEKLDFCVLSFDEMRAMIERVRAADRRDPSVYRPLVAIGHTKDLIDLDAVEQTLVYLKSAGISISGFERVAARCGHRQRTARERTEVAEL